MDLRLIDRIRRLFGIRLGNNEFGLSGLFFFWTFLR